LNYHLNNIKRSLTNENLVTYMYGRPLSCSSVTISVILQRFNSALIHETFSASDDELELLDSQSSICFYHSL